MKQPWVIFGTTFQSPKLFTTLPSGSNSINDGDVILCVNAHSADLPDYPFFRQRLWPAGINYEFRTVAVCLRTTDDSHCDHQAYAKPNLSETPYFFLHFVSHGG